MFTGLIETTSPILQVRNIEGQRWYRVARPRGWRLQAGQSVSVDGVCSTVQRVNRAWFQVAYMPETLRKTTLGERKVGDGVNLERSLTLQTLLGGHLVMGHVDTTARIIGIREDGSAKIYEFHIPRPFARYVVPKGCIAVDGISLTVVDAGRGRFTTSLLPYTLRCTTLGGKKAGDRVNIETDIVAKYLEKLVKEQR